MLQDKVTEETFHNTFFQFLLDLSIPEFQAARIFIFWIEHDFHSYVEKYADMDKLDILEAAHMSFLAAGT